MNADKNVEFLRKLQSLLSEYDARIHWNFNECSDMHGVSGEGIGIEVGRKEVLNVQGMSLSAYDIKQELEDQHQS